MSEGIVESDAFRKAIAAYLRIAYAGGSVPAAVQQKVAAIESIPAGQVIPESHFEVSECNGKKAYALRLGQPIYPHMKIVIDSCPGGGYLLRADAHDAHLHAPPGSADEKPLALLRARNKELTEAIEAAWVGLGLPTFRDYLRRQIASRRLK